MASETEIKAFVSAFAEHWNDEAGGFESIMHKDATLQVAGTSEPLPYDQAAQFVAFVKRSIPDLSLEVLNWAERDGQIFTEWEMTGTIGGKKVSWHGINRNTLEGSKSVGAVSCWDRHALMSQIDESLTPLDLAEQLAQYQSG